MSTAKARNARVWLSRISQGGQPIYFSAKTGGGRTSDSTTEYNGGSLVAEVSTAPPQTENIVVTLRYDPARDYGILRKLDDQVGFYTDTLNILDTDSQLNPIPGVPTAVYPNATLVGMSGIDYDANGSDSRTCQLTFAVGARAS